MSSWPRPLLFAIRRDFCGKVSPVTCFDSRLPSLGKLVASVFVVAPVGLAALMQAALSFFLDLAKFWKQAEHRLLPGLWSQHVLFLIVGSRLESF